MSYKQDTVSAYPTLQPLDWGASFAFSRKRLLLSFALVPALIESGVAYVHYYRPLAPQDLFLVFVLSTLVSCWLLTVTVMMCIEDARAMVIRPFQLAVDAMRNLPKIFFSYLALLSAVFAAVIIFPLLLLVLFFVWAPFFCIGELFVKVPPKRKYDDDLDDIDSEYDDEDGKPRTALFFSRKSLIELGFARSLQLGSKNAGATLQITLLIWFANVVPLAIVDFISFNVHAFWPEMLKIVTASLSEVLAVAVSAGAFLSMLPAHAREEIGITDPLRFPPVAHGRVLGKAWVSVVLLVVCGLASFLVLKDTQKDHRMPESIVSELQKIELHNKAFVATVRLTDAEYNFRWLDPNGFQLTVPKAPAPVVNVETPKVEQVKVPVPAKEAAKEAVTAVAPSAIPVHRVALFSEDGKEISQTTLAPYFAPIKLVLEFEVPESMPQQGNFTLEYTSYFGDTHAVYQGTYGGQSSDGR